MSHPDKPAKWGTRTAGKDKGRKTILFLGLCLFWVLGGCALLPEKIDIPTLMPEEEIPTAIALTAQAMIESDAAQSAQAVEREPTFTPHDPGSAPVTAGADEGNPHTSMPSGTATPVLATPSPSPTYALEDLSPIDLPQSLPHGEIQILNPGQLSKVVSPIDLHVFLLPGADDRVRVALYGEDGRLLVRRVLRYDSPRDNKVHLKLDLEFEIPGVAETARLEISTHDAYGRVMALNSTDIILLSEGDSDINPPLDTYEELVIEEPVPNTLIQGGQMIVKGFTRHVESGQLYVEILNYSGGVVGSKLIGVSDQELGKGYHFYAGEIPYQVGSATWVRVQVSARDHDLSGVLHTSTVRVLISP